MTLQNQTQFKTPSFYCDATNIASLLLVEQVVLYFVIGIDSSYSRATKKSDKTEIIFSVRVVSNLVHYSYIIVVVSKSMKTPSLGYNIFVTVALSEE